MNSVSSWQMKVTSPARPASSSARAMPRLPRADIVEPGEAGIGGEQRPRLAVGALGIVADLAQFDDLELGIFLGEDVAEAHLALLVAAIAEAAGEQRDLAAARPA